jgi:hypothetical protein
MSDDAATVERDATLFHFGHYPAKGWGITRAEFEAANAGVEEIPVGLDPKTLDHYHGEANVLDGRLGLARIAVTDGAITSRLRIDPLLDRIIREEGLSPSVVFGEKSKVIRRVDFVKFPHDREARVHFSEGDDEGEIIVFADDADPEVGFCDEGKLDLAQQHHEVMASMHPGLCMGKGDRKVQFADESPRERKLMHHMQVFHDHIVHAGGAYCPGMDHHGEVGMSDERDIETPESEDELLASFSEDDASPTERALFNLVKRVVADNKQTKAENARLSGHVGTLTGTLAEEKAVSFADEMTKGPNRRATPAERDAIRRGYLRAVKADAASDEPVEFSDPKDPSKAVKGSHLDAFKALYLIRPKLPIGQEKAVGFSVDLPAEPTDGVDPEQAELDRIDAETRKFAAGLNGKK